MHICEACRRAPAAWLVELDTDLPAQERVRFEVCDGCLCVDQHDPNLAIHWIGESEAAK